MGGGGGGGAGGGGAGGGNGRKGGAAAHGWMIVCEYWPPGNVETQYAAQVQRQINGANRAGVSRPGPAGWGWGGVLVVVVVIVVIGEVM